MSTALRSIWLQTASISFALALLLVALVAACEFYAATRFESQYVSAKEYQALSRWLLVGKRERGTFLNFDDRGYHAVSPDITMDGVTSRLKERYPNEYDPKKISWVLTDDEGAFFYRLGLNWYGGAFLFLIAFLIALFPVHYILRSATQSPYLLRGRLADVLALIQVLALDRDSHRSESGLTAELQGKPASSENWTALAKAHPELFRVKLSGENVVSLIARHVTEPTDQLRKPLSTEYLAVLLDLAVEVHDREIQRTRGWHVWVPLIVAVVAGIFTLVSIVFGHG